MTASEQINGLAALTTTQLQARYAEVLGKPTKSRNRLALVRAISRRLEAAAPAESKPAARVAAKRASKPRAKPDAPFQHDPRVPAVGSVLRHQHGDETVEVRVTKTGFSWKGKPYRSLSAIAKEASGGTPWNGFLYFGLIGQRQRKPRAREGS